ncbi:DUF817 domain-containing protein [Sandaracinobacteroides saxicola]|uniref:DUF817 domain-containing protein n=1 Tax=Sandaracinobacteroides saxicola TaxID=2759707 RepID=A0A7G5IKZ2_9SPHN|nr:DUF817 domain-containing protein [Sandaracinobacteroides saxicola]QMW24034.1 DUF817 domain-containing protein [Sandaracinobacteroides saxicola]
MAERRTRFAGVRDRLEGLRFASPLHAGLFEFLLFGFKQAWACLFGGLILALLLLTHFFYPADAALARYDFLTLVVLAIQVALLALRLETLAEARVILAFHLVGTAMELFKTSMGSWVYPEPGLLRIGDVPLFSGFMYAAVGSYIARIWRIFGFRFTGYPPAWQPTVLAVAIYVNFFTHHFVADARWLLFAACGWIFRRTMVRFTVFRTERAMPLLVGFLLVALFIWFAENLATFANAWRYPLQSAAWTMVPLAKLGAWYLLMIISFVLVSRLHAISPATSRTSR